MSAKFFSLIIFYPMMNHLFEGSGLFQDDSAPTHSVQGLTERFGEDENGVNHMLWLS